MRRTVVGSGIAALAFSVPLVLWAPPAHANHITSCSEACAIDCATAGYTESSCQTAESGKCLIEDDLSCASSDTGVALYQGADLTFERGRTISCPNDDCVSGVVVKGAGSTISTQTDGEGTALGGTAGGFHYAIQCNAWNDSKVDRLQVSGGIVGVMNCETVTNNIIETYDREYLTVNRGINWTTKVNSGSAADKASGNIVRDKVWAITATGTGTKVLIEDNNIMSSTYNAIVFLKDSSATWTVRDNNIHGSGDAGYTQFFYQTNPAIFSGSTTGATATNLCSVDDHPGCEACIAAGACTSYVPE